MSNASFLIQGHSRSSDDNTDETLHKYSNLVHASDLQTEDTRNIALTLAGDCGVACKQIAGTSNRVKLTKRLQVEDTLTEALFDLTALAQKLGFSLEGLMQRKMQQKA
jgi:hypothetical protein